MGTYYHQLKHPLDDVKIDMDGGYVDGYIRMSFCKVSLYAQGELISQTSLNPDYLGVFMRGVCESEPVAKRSNVGEGRTVTQLLRAPDKDRMAVFVSEYGEVVRGAEWALPVAGSIVTGVDDA